MGDVPTKAILKPPLCGIFQPATFDYWLVSRYFSIKCWIRAAFSCWNSRAWRACRCHSCHMAQFQFVSAVLIFFLGPLHQGSDPGFPTITVQGIFHLVHEKRSAAVFMKPPMEHHDWWCPYIAKLVSNGVYGKYQYEPPTLRPDENARRSLQCSNLFSSGPQPITVLRDIQVCRWITSKLVCSIFRVSTNAFITWVQVQEKIS